MRSVFLSYASQDAEAAARICAALRAAGIEVWSDQSKLASEVAGQIASCALFLPLISQHTQARFDGNFRLEWKLAAQRTHTMADEKAFLLPVVIDGTREPDALVPTEFRAAQWTRLMGGDAPPAFVGRVQRLLDGPAPSPLQRQIDASAAPGAHAPNRLGLIVGVVALLLIGVIAFIRIIAAPG